MKIYRGKGREREEVKKKERKKGKQKERKKDVDPRYKVSLGGLSWGPWPGL